MRITVARREISNAAENGAEDDGKGSACFGSFVWVQVSCQEWRASVASSLASVAGDGGFMLKTGPTYASAAPIMAIMRDRGDVNIRSILCIDVS